MDRVHQLKKDLKRLQKDLLSATTNKQKENLRNRIKKIQEQLEIWTKLGKARKRK